PERGGDRVGGAAADSALVVNFFGALVTQVYFGWQGGDGGRRCGEEMIPRVWKVGNPSVASGLAAAKFGHDSLLLAGMTAIAWLGQQNRTGLACVIRPWADWYNQQPRYSPLCPVQVVLSR